jgi:hypothetical protein
MTMSRRTFLKLLVGGGLAAATGFALSRNISNANPKACGEYDLDCIASNLVSGGPPKDGIPAINSPVLITGAEAETNGWVSDDSLVDALVSRSDARAYPRSITVWHEIVNDIVDGVPTSLTFCPLTGSAIAYQGQAPNGTPLTFGTTGMLSNSNLVMYDRQTNSTYPQILGVGISGPKKGVELEQIPVTTTRWKLWKQAYPNTRVLSRQTSYYSPSRYNTYAYGDYDSNSSVYFPVAYESSRFFPKKPVIGARVGSESLAVLKEEFRSKSVANITLGGLSIVALYDLATDYARIFSRTVNGSAHTFNYNNATITDAETSSQWTPQGKSIAGSLAGTQLSRVNSFQVMWFGWYAFHPSTSTYPQ